MSVKIWKGAFAHWQNAKDFYSEWRLSLLETASTEQAKIFLVHRLVAMAFIPNPNGYDTVNHKDENKTIIALRIWNGCLCIKITVMETMTLKCV